MIVFLLCLTSILFATTLEEIEYSIKRGSTLSTSNWKVTKDGENIILTVNLDNNLNIYTFDSDFNTLRWYYDDPEINTKFEAILEGDIVKVTGTSNGETVQEEFELNGLPWYQKMAFCFRPFIKGDDEVVKFMAIMPNSLTLYEFKATKADIEEIETDVDTVLCQHVKLSLSGWKSKLWSSDMWYRCSDGTYIKFEGTIGLPSKDNQLYVTLKSQKGSL